MVPSGLSISAKRRTTLVPAGPFTFSRIQPVKFCPRSKTHTPGFTSVSRTVFNSWVLRTG